MCQLCVIILNSGRKMRARIPRPARRAFISSSSYFSPAFTRANVWYTLQRITMFITAMASRKRDETSVPMTPADGLVAGELIGERDGCKRQRQRRRG